MKEEIIKFFETDRSFNGAIALYSKHGRNANFLRSVNIKGDTPKNKENLLYELFKLIGLSGIEYNKLLNVPLKSKEQADLESTAALELKLANEAEALKIKVRKEAENFVLEADFNSIDIDQDKAFSLAQTLELQLEDEDPETVLLALEIFKNEYEAANTVKALLAKAPEEFAKSVKLRQEFPFLNESTCPDELKILVADMLTAHHNYMEAHPKLALAENAEEINTLAETVVENYLENRSIWEELKHYKEKGEILGEHSKLKELAFRKELESMSTPELIKLKDSLYNKITRTKKQITDDNKPHLVEERTARVAEFENQFAIVKKLLGIEG